MPLSEATVNPINSAAPAAATAPALSAKPAPEATSQKAKGKLKIPSAVATNPAVILTLTQKVPGVVFPDKLEGSKETKPLEDNAKLLQQMGLMFARSKSKDAIMFNPAVVKPEEVQKAIDADKVFEIFPEYSQVVSGAQKPDAAASGLPAGAAAGLTPQSPQGLPKPPANVQKATQTARVTPPDIAPGGSNVLGGLQARAI